MTAVQTVLGPVEASELGVTLMHEHLLVDARTWHHSPAPDDREGQEIACAQVAIEFLGRLRHDPFLSLDNCLLDDVDLAVEEAARLRRLGGATIVDPTCRAIGRDPAALREISARSGLQVVMGSGYYLQPTHPPAVAAMSLEAIAEEIERDVSEGVDGSRAGFVGEIGVSPSFTAQEHKVLRAAARAVTRTRVPLSVHLPAWYRHGHRVLDTVAEEGGNPAATVLCHMNPSLADPDYQASLAERGAWLEYDMCGMEYFYADQQAQCPSDEQSAAAVAALVRDGWGHRLLLSGDVFVKTLLVRYGGGGYAHVLEHFVPRLRRHGLDQDVIDKLLIDNPRTVFETAAKERTT